MGIVATILVGLGAILCFVRPVPGFCAYLATIIIRPNEQWDGVLVPGIPIMIVAAGLGYLLHQSRALPRLGPPRSKAVPLLVGMTAFLFIHLLLLHRERLVDWILSDVAQIMLLLLYLTRHLSTPERLAVHVTTVTASTSLVVGIPFFVHFLFKGPRRVAKGVESYGALWDTYHLEVSNRLMGKKSLTWGNSNELGMLCNWGIAGGLYHLRRKGSKLVKLAALAVLGMLGGALMLTGSRSGQLQLGITIWMVFVGGKRKALGIILLLVAMVGIVVVLPKLAPARADADASARERQMVLQAAIQIFKESPLVGIGFTSFPERSPRKLHAHNVYMQCLTETGLLGAGIFFPLIFFLRRETSMAVKYFEQRSDPNMALLGRCIGAVQAGYSVFMFFSNQFMRFTFAIPMIGAVALHAAMQRDLAKQAAEAASPDLEASGPRGPIEVAPERPRLEAPARPLLEAHSPERSARRPRAASDAPRQLGGRRARAASDELEPHEGAGRGEPGPIRRAPTHLDPEEVPDDQLTSGPRYVFDPDVPQLGVQTEEDSSQDETGRRGPPPTPRRPPPRRGPA
jgi:O-antigen ligase